MAKAQLHSRDSPCCFTRPLLRAAKYPFVSVLSALSFVAHSTHSAIVSCKTHVGFCSRMNNCDIVEGLFVSGSSSKSKLGRFSFEGQKPVGSLEDVMKSFEAHCAKNSLT